MDYEIVKFNFKGDFRVYIANLCNYIKSFYIFYQYRNIK